MAENEMVEAPNQILARWNRETEARIKRAENSIFWEQRELARLRKQQRELSAILTDKS